jgi:hypothetical protein
MCTQLLVALILATSTKCLPAQAPARVSSGPDSSVSSSRPNALDTAGDVRVSYDRFTDTTTVSLLSLQLNQFLLLNAEFQYPGQRARRPKDIHFRVLSIDSKSFDEVCHSVRLLRDQERVQLSQPVFLQDTTRKPVRQLLMFSATMRESKMMAEARSVEGRICQSEFAFTDPQLDRMADFLNKAYRD